ncbi:traB domain-containing protein-like [Populus alba x Populus x berolinensis]|nr:traB domain-containing protein-like [Populus alba x Populus x berolinensis]
MDPNPSNEEFVHIENPSDNDNHLSESIVDVANELSEDDNKNDDVAERKELPEELSRSVMVLTCESKAEGGTCVVHLVGTAHVCQESCREVQAVISYLKPQVVFLELCASRVAMLSPQKLKVPTMGEMIKMWKKNHNTFGILYSWFLAKVADKLEVFPGSEFRVAFEEARKYEGKVVLGDRPVQADCEFDTMGCMLDIFVLGTGFSLLWLSFLSVNLGPKIPHQDIIVHLSLLPQPQLWSEKLSNRGPISGNWRTIIGPITLRRTWGKMPVWHKVKFMYSLLFQALFLPSSEDLEKMLKEMDDVDMLTLVIQEMSKQFPTLMETLVQERDQYMSSTLLRIAKEHNSVVAVVGKGHLQGIKRHWEQHIELKDLMELPSQKSTVSARKVLASLGVAVAGVAIVSGIYLSRKK